MAFGIAQSLGLALSDDEEQAILDCVNDIEEMSDELYQKLFDHFCATNEMPYGVAKARTGDPYKWIADRLEVAVKDAGYLL